MEEEEVSPGPLAPLDAWALVQKKRNKIPEKEYSWGNMKLTIFLIISIPILKIADAIHNSLFPFVFILIAFMAFIIWYKTNLNHIKNHQLDKVKKKRKKGKKK